MSQGSERVVAGRYRLIRQLGRGGMGVVWQARDEVLDRDVALKEIYLSGLGADDPLSVRALREARAAAQLQHSGIITVHDVVIEEGRPWIVMELIDGPSLGQVVADEGVLPEHRVAVIGLQVLAALRVAHRSGILHRDVKPPNILLDGERVVLTDFGIAAIDGATALTVTGQMVGSPAYLAPERINGRPATTASDLWAFGVSLYVAVSGRSPFQREDALSTFAAVLTSDPVPPAGIGRLWPIIAGLLVKDPAGRLTAEPAAELLAAVADLSTVPAGPAQPRWPRRLRSREHAEAVPPAVLATSRPGTETSPVRYVTARRRRRAAVRLIGILAAVSLLPATSLTGEPPGRRGVKEGPADGSGTRPASPVVALPAATGTPSPVPNALPTPPAPPPGFKTVHVDGPLYLAIPQSWEVKNDDIGKRLQPIGSKSWLGFVYDANVEKGVSAAVFLRDYVAHSSQNHRRIRLTSVAVPRGGSSAAEWEYTETQDALSLVTSLTRERASLSEHRIATIVNAQTGVPVILFGELLDGLSTRWT
ncbi:serine/threonine-protein kinase [Actinoplanes sp. NPDC051470]|uniref:serine/threonine-protein kinase n=1 Tax=Actinoplanes sp. NPDC051470 TaxID=3157224 RepID=UPI00342500B6